MVFVGRIKSQNMNEKIIQNGNETEALLSRADVAAALKVSGRTVARMARSGALPEIKLGHRTPRYRPSDISRLIASVIV